MSGTPRITWSKWNRYTWYGTTEGMPKDFIQITNVTRPGGETLYNYNVLGWNNITERGLADAKRKSIEMMKDRWPTRAHRPSGGKRRHATLDGAKKPHCKHGVVKSGPRKGLCQRTRTRAEALIKATTELRDAMKVVRHNRRIRRLRAWL
jgi:hypothetical protein